jgi:hypothetical protein
MIRIPNSWKNITKRIMIRIVLLDDASAQGRGCDRRFFEWGS